MFKLDISKFIDTGSFFSEGNLSLKTIQDSCDESFGSDVIMYYFEREGYDISFVYDQGEEHLIAEQFETTLVGDNQDAFLLTLLSFESFRKVLSCHIEAIYFDDCGEKVLFMKNGVNAHFNDNILTKMTSKSEITRNFVVKHMTKMKIYDAAP